MKRKVKSRQYVIAACLTRMSVAVTFIALAIMRAAPAGAADYYKTADGIAVYLGVLPAELVLGHSPEHPETQMHGSVPRGKRQHHVVIALFDTRRGERITDAAGTARVREVELAPVSKKLEPMLIDKTVSYGNYFAMSAPGPYSIDIEIRRRGASRPVNVSFQYSHPR